MDRSLWFDTAMSGSAEATPFLFVRPTLSSLPPLLSSSDSIDPIDPPPSPSSNSDVGFIPLRFSSFMNNDSGRSSPESTTKKAEKNREGTALRAKRLGIAKIKKPKVDHVPLDSPPSSRRRQRRERAESRRGGGPDSRRRRAGEKLDLARWKLAISAPKGYDKRKKKNGGVAMVGECVRDQITCRLR
ncbi:hypothetical protein GW17_00004092 [Ensete ventricosum]|nr:hypothetical protein GW17_00004092 [Ensete ventricosum]